MPKTCVLGPVDVFWRFWLSRNHEFLYHFLELSINLGWSMMKVDPIYVIFNMGLALFHKQLYENRNICKRGIGKIRIFFNWIAYWIAYWPLLFRCGITAPCYSGVEWHGPSVQQSSCMPANMCMAAQARPCWLLACKHVCVDTCIWGRPIRHARSDSSTRE